MTTAWAGRPLRIAFTAGDPGGVGPELLLQIAGDATIAPDAALPEPAVQRIIIGSRDLLVERARALQIPILLTPFDPEDGRPNAPGEWFIDDVALCGQAVPGHADPIHADHVLETLRRAVAGCLEQRFDAMVTGPIHKAAIHAARLEGALDFRGHTEWLAEEAERRTGRPQPQPVMMLATPARHTVQGSPAIDFRVALVTTHLPLRQVPDAITREAVQHCIATVHHDLIARFAIQRPRIAVCGLNPHAGEDGLLGTEEREIIAPALEALRDTGIDCVGPLPADTAFAAHHLADFDVFVAMYHDQGLPVLKHRGFGTSVNITLGLPFIRTSVDHGTALDLAGTGRADSGSLKAAARVATHMATAARYGSGGA